MKKNNLLLGIIMSLIPTLSWGGMFAIMQDTLTKIDPIYFTFFRYGSASIILMIILYLLEGKESFKIGNRKALILFLGTLGFAGFNFLVFLGQKLAGTSGAIIASIMMGVQPLIGIVLNWLIKKQRPNNLTILYMFMALAGVVLVITKGDFSIFVSGQFNIWSILLIFIGACCWVLYSMGISFFEGWSSIRYTTLTATFGSLSMIVIIAIFTGVGVLTVPTFGVVKSIIGPLAYMSLIAGVLAAICWNKGNQTIGNINAIIFMNMVPVTTFTITTIMGYQIKPIELCGAALTIVSLLLNNLNLRKKMKAQTN